MVCYVTHKYEGLQENIEKAKEITRFLSIDDPENTYICPLLALSHLQYNEIGKGVEMEMRLDLLSAFDQLVVASEVSKGVKKEIEFAKSVNMEVVYLDRSFEKSMGSID